MLILVTGGSCSGKSAFAEELVERLVDQAAADSEFPIENKYYIATMEAFDEESIRRIERHQKARAGKKFETIEQGRNVKLAAQKMQGANRIALLECMSNLVANEMFGNSNPPSVEALVDRVVGDVEALAWEVSNLVIVSNNVFEDGICYDKTTMEYLRALGEINTRLATSADMVYEVVVGIPVVIKTKRSNQ